MFEKVQEIISDVLSIDKSIIFKKTLLSELGVDSLDFYEIASKIEDEFHVNTDDYVLENILTIEDIIVQLINVDNKKGI